MQACSPPRALIAGEAILGLVWAGTKFTPESFQANLQIFAHPSYFFGLVAMALLGFLMIRWPLGAAGSPDEPAPPVAMM